MIVLVQNVKIFVLILFIDFILFFFSLLLLLFQIVTLIELRLYDPVIPLWSCRVGQFI